MNAQRPTLVFIREYARTYTKESTMDREQYIKEMAAGYIECALFDAPEDIIPPKSGQFDVTPHLARVSEDMKAIALAECTRFYDANVADLTTYAPDDAGHDLFFTAGHHGVGFWEADHCTEEEGERLTASAHKMIPARTVYVGDGDGLYYLE